MPVPESLRSIESARLDVVTRLQRIEVEAARLGVRPVFCRDIFSADYGRLVRVEDL